MQLEVARPASRRLISLTPLIDVVFILLLFFMLASSFQQWNSMSLNIPAKSSGSSKTLNDQLALIVQNNGLIKLHESTFNISNLTDEVAGYLVENPNRLIIVKPEENVDLQTLVRVIDELSTSGAKQLSLGNVIQ